MLTLATLAACLERLTSMLVIIRDIESTNQASLIDMCCYCSLASSAMITEGEYIP